MKKILIIGMLVLAVFGTLGWGIAWHIRHNTGENLLFRANLAMRASNFNKAADLATRYINDTPDDWRGHDVLGRASMRLGRYETARTAYQEAARLDPTKIEAILGLANAYSDPAAEDVAEGKKATSSVTVLRKVIDRFIKANSIIQEAMASDPQAGLELRERLGRDYARISQAWRVIADRRNEAARRTEDANLSEIHKLSWRQESDNATIEADKAAILAIETLLEVVKEDPSRPRGSATLVGACIEHIEQGPNRNYRLNERIAKAEGKNEHDTVRTLNQVRAGIDKLLAVSRPALKTAREKIMALDNPPVLARMALALNELMSSADTDTHDNKDRLRKYCKTLNDLLDDNPDEVPLKLTCAKAAFALGEYDIAEGIANEILDTNPRQGQARLIRARLALKDGKFAEAEGELLTLTNDYSTWAEARYYYGLVSAANGRKEIALLAMRKAVELDPEHAGARQYLITSLSRGSFHDLAFVEAEGYYNARPDDPTAVLLLVRTAMNLNTRRPAIASKTLAAARVAAVRTKLDEEGEPTGGTYIDRPLMFAVGEGYTLIRDRDKAQEAYQQAALAEPTDLAGRIAHAKALLRLGRTPEAEAIFTAVLEKDSSLHQVHFELSKLCAETGRPFQAIDHMRTAIDLDDRNTIYRLALAGLWFDAGDIDQCAKALEKLGDDDEEANLLRMRVKLVMHETIQSDEMIAQIDRTRRGGLALALTYLKTGQPRWCVSVCQDALKSSPDDPALLFLLGQAHLAMGQKDKCIDSWSQALRSAPRQLPTYLGLGRLLARTLEPSKVGEALRRIPHTQPDMVDLTVAWLNSRRGNYDEAARIYAQLAANSDMPQYSRLSARILRTKAVASLEKTDQALAELKALEDELGGLGRWKSKIRWARVDILTDAGRNDQAYMTLKELAETARGKPPENEPAKDTKRKPKPDAAALRRVATHFVRLKYFDDALALCEEVKTIVPNDAGTYLLQTTVLIAAKRTDETPVVLEEAIKRQSSNVKLYTALAGVHDALNQPDKVLLTLKRMAELGGAGKARALFEEGRYLASWGLATQAEERLEQLRKQGYGTSPSVQLDLGRALARVGSTKQAREAVKTIPIYCDQYVDAQSLLADLAENDDEGLAILARLTKDKPDSTVAFQRQMWMMIRAGKSAEATKAFQAFAKRTGRTLAMPSGAYPLALQALLDADETGTGTAAAEFVRNRAKESNSIEWKRLGILLSINNEPAEAKTMLPAPTADGLWLHDALLGVILASKTNDAQAAAQWAGVVDKISRLAATRTPPAVIPPHYRLLSALATGTKADPAWAKKTNVGSEAALELIGNTAAGPSVEAANLLKATLAIEWGRRHLGQSWAMEILKNRPTCQWAAELVMQTRPNLDAHRQVVELLKPKECALALRIEGSLFRERGEFKKAAQLYAAAARAAKTPGSDTVLLVAQAVTTERAAGQEEDPKKARDLLEAALRLYRTVYEETKAVQAGNNAAFLVSELHPDDTGELEKALKWAQANVKAHPDNPTLLDTRGWILHLMGKTDEARKDLRRAVKGKPMSPEIHYHLGVVEAEAQTPQDELAKWHFQAAVDCADRMRKAGEKLTVSATKAATLAARTKD